MKRLCSRLLGEPNRGGLARLRGISRELDCLLVARGVASRYLVNYSGWQRLLDARCLLTPAHWLRAAVRQA
jgi:hypothetical protein